MKPLFYTATLLSALTIASTSSAQDSGAYAGFSIGFLKYEEDGISANPTLGVGRVGYNINPNFAIEGELGFTLATDTIDEGGIEFDVGASYQAIFAKGSIAASDNVNLFARAGVMKAELEAEAMGITVSVDDTSFAYGIGAEIFTDGPLDIRAEVYKATFEDNGAEGDATVLAIGGTYKF